MKTKILSTLVLAIALTGYGQGTINFQNSSTPPNAAQRITTNGVAGGYMSIVPNQFQFALYYGASASSLTSVSSSFLNSTATAGIIAGNSSLVLTGFGPGQTVFFQVFGWSFGQTLAQAQTTPGSYWGSSTIASVAAGNAQNPAGTQIFFNASNANQITGFTLNQVVPEPSTMVLAGLGAASLLLFRRRKQA